MSASQFFILWTAIYIAPNLKEETRIMFAGSGLAAAAFFYVLEFLK